MVPLFGGIYLAPTNWFIINMAEKTNKEERRRLILHDFIALLILIIGILTILSIASFKQADSFFFTTSPEKPVNNLIGTGGAVWSSILLLGFGRPSYIVGVIIFLFGWYLLIKKNKTEAVFNLTGFFILMVTLTILFSIKLNQPPKDILIKNGGIIGLFLKNEVLEPYLGITGVYIVSISLIVFSVMLITNFSLKSVVSFLNDIVKGIKKIGQFFKKLFTPEVKDIEDEKPPLINKVVVAEEKDDVKEEKNISERVKFSDYKEKKSKIKEEKEKKNQFPETKDEDKGINEPFEDYNFPPADLLTASPKINEEEEKKYIYQKGEKLEKTLKEFDVEAKVINIYKGPVITRYELQPASGIKVNKIVSLSDNIALSLAAQRVRIVAPIPGKAAVGVEIPNVKRNIVTLGDILQSKEFQKKYELVEIALGKDISGSLVKINLKDCPHLLIAGATGSGKSVLLNSIICGLLYNVKPDKLRFIIIDPKMVELKIYNGIPHLMTEVITNPKHCIIILKYLVGEMEKRYQLLDEVGARDIDKYNERIKKGRFKELDHLPYIVVIIDEFSDLMMVTAREIEELIVRLAQKARAVGIHLIIATQRPSVDVITGLIKANFPSRIAFQVASRIDSRTILDSIGADKLLGKGDMLVSLGYKPGLMRVQGAYISEEEVEEIIQYIGKENLKLDYLDINDLIEKDERKDLEQSYEDEYDEIYYKAKDVVKETKKASASFLQRRLKIGFNRAARYIDMMENEGLIGPPVGSKPREVYLDKF